ncbi:MAG: hypothetical protein JRH01_25440 [Deltaproteobacteria bacterium]|nr:hypothetical protein [Deltaproteobacteria bacterium]MBW2397191.1 hypothetical protein [Deltaproteobacteria bacterium]
MRREMEDLRLHLIRESQQRDELLTIVSHELRTPITVIDGFNKLLLSGQAGPLTDEQRRFLEESRKSCRRLNLFVANLLEKERLRVGESAPHLAINSLRTLLEGVAAFLAPLVAESDQKLETLVEPDAEMACFDPMSIEQVLVNLIGNGFKYGRRGGTLRVCCQRLGGEPSYIEVAVLDDGPGIPEEERERIFEPYVRRAEHKGSGGLGLGLAICRRIVAAHGGSIGVGEAPGGGSRFAFSLPVEPVEPVALVAS